MNKIIKFLIPLVFWLFMVSDHVVVINESGSKTELNFFLTFKVLGHLVFVGGVVLAFFSCKLVFTIFVMFIAYLVLGLALELFWRCIFRNPSFLFFE